MSGFNKFPERSRDQQDGTERHIWGEQEYIDGKGSIIKVNGTDTEDQEATVLVIGGGSFNLPKGSNTEVILLAGGSDTNMKFALLTTPFDKQRKWKENTGGIQNPTDPDKAVEFNGKRTHLTEGNAAIGPTGAFEVKGDTIYVRGKLVIEGDVEVGGGVNAGGGLNTSGSLKASSVHASDIYSNEGHDGPDSPDSAPGSVPGFEA